MQNLKLLLVEDNLNLAQTLKHALASAYLVDYASSGEAALSKAEIYSYPLVILDLNLPDMSGLEICRQLKARGNGVSILVLTGEFKIMSKIKLLDAGADDYLTKPFSLGELKARLRVLSRQAQAESGQQRLQAGELVLDRNMHLVMRGDRVVKLRRKEFALLECLMLRAGTVVTRDMLAAQAWYGNQDPWTNTIDVHIKSLRDRIDRPFETRLIKTIHGLGYRLEVSPSTSRYTP